ncbi:Doublecortin domain-containing protein 2B [Liparis tanakae]|uniref:Doublecortin domain-containing protein 2B n=1 Tax=Liparis tanakae TaxID=230148 RepID=A0A4Z2FNC8_9TELE|nr:Doublecortin domain-containing protein 2B [Liparis tanakae]
MAALPPVKSVVVYRNGDPFYGGRRFVVNLRQVATMEAFLTEVTHSIGAPLAVRTLYTPRRGHRVPELRDLQTGAQYVAAGFERFKKLEPTARSIPEVVYIAGNNVVMTVRPIDRVFRNGDLLCPPFRFLIPRSMQQDLEKILGVVTEKVSLRTGAVRRLCSLDGATVSSALELETGHCYVAVGTERFKKLPYVELLISKATERYCVFPKAQQPSVFRRAGRRRREEARGAEEVQEDEDTRTELPVDQRVAETVEEEPNGRNTQQRRSQVLEDALPSGSDRNGKQPPSSEQEAATQRTEESAACRVPTHTHGAFQRAQGVRGSSCNPKGVGSIPALPLAASRRAGADVEADVVKVKTFFISLSAADWRRRGKPTTSQRISHHRAQ